MDEKKLVKTSKFLSLVLRHKPETIGIELDANGWVDVDELLKACAGAWNAITPEELRMVVETNDKKRFAFDDLGERIRASQGHTVEIDLDLKKETPPDVLYHGTAVRNLEAIRANGLKKMQRHHVHLSAETETAKNVGMRYGKPIVFEVDAAAMHQNDFEFYISANGVWLVDNVPAKYLNVP